MRALLTIAVITPMGCVSRNAVLALPRGVERHERKNGRIDYVIRNIRDGRTNATAAVTFYELCQLQTDLRCAVPSDVAYQHDLLDRSIVLYGVDGDLARKIHDNMCVAGLLRDYLFWDELLIQEKKSPEFSSRLFEPAHTNALLPNAVGVGSSVFSLSHIPNGRTVFTVHDNAYTNNTATDFRLECTNGVLSLRTVGKERKASSAAIQKFPTKVPIRYDRAKVGTVLISAASSGCVDHRAYALRIFDASGRYIWQAPKFIVATPGILRAVDVDADGIDEIILCVDNHMIPEVLIFKRVPE